MKNKLRYSNSRALVGHLGSIYTLSNVDGQLLSAGGDGNVVLWNAQQEKPGIVVANVETQLYCLCTIGQLVIAGSMNGAIYFIDLDTRALRKKLVHHQKGVFSIITLAGMILTGGGDGIVTLWDLDLLIPKFSIRLSTLSIRSMTHIEGQHFAVGCSEGNLYYCMVEDGAIKLERTKNKAHQSSVFCLSYDSTHQKLLSGGRDAQLNFFDLDLNLLETIPAHLFTINSIAIHSGLGLFATGSRDKTIKIWDLDNHRLLQVLEAVRDFGHFNSINALLWIGDSLFSGSDDRKIICWTAPDNEQKA